MANLSKTTQDHEEIRRWAEERGAHPSCVRGTGGEGDIGMLRLDFPGFSGEESLEHISWDEWFEKFDERNLALLYQEETAGGERSNFNKIVSAETAQEAESGSQRKGASARGGRASSRAASSSSQKRSSGGAKASKSKSASKKGGAGSTAKKGAKSAAGPRKGGAAKGAAKKGATGKKTAAKSSSAKKSPAKKAGSKKSASKKGRR